MTWFIGQSLVFILLAFLLGVLVGRLSARFTGRRGTTPEPTFAAAPEKSESNLRTPEKVSPEKALSAEKASPATVTESAAAGTPVADEELERIEGIGPKMADALRAAGIHSFAQLAESDDDTKRSAIRAAGLSFAPSLVTWSRQARLIADGDEEAFAELTARLIAGRDTDPARSPNPDSLTAATTRRPSPRPAGPPTAGRDQAAAGRDAEIVR
ncbi:helix-hairpin-helix domain-containing protein [Actinoplanes awajinensis]|uniref:helix-hairpin-helix domain-containing protein n=1 Tax=Actinoplanes awajinensis TaxID=135946 RepID=UPI0012F7225A|nr:helix-hairpin-helix domain-containing protein [Actinoplanes awajinensis]